MKLYEFYTMCHDAQMEYLYKHGIYLGKRKEGKTIIVLYQIQGFYIEIFYTSYRAEISSIWCFKGTRQLAPYLQQVNIEELLPSCQIT